MGDRDFSDTLLCLKLIVKLEKTSVAQSDWTSIAPANNLLHFIFQQVELVIGEEQVTSAHNTYSYEAYLKTLMVYGKDAKNS